MTKTGQYFNNDKGSYATAHPDAYDKEKVESLLNLTRSIPVL
ncbi:hypothetical protein [Maribacter sp. LLG6340-A2]